MNPISVVYNMDCLEYMRSLPDKHFDFYACELDKEYFDAQEERFQKECFGVQKLSSGKTIIQQSLF